MSVGEVAINRGDGLLCLDMQYPVLMRCSVHYQAYFVNLLCEETMTSESPSEIYVFTPKFCFEFGLIGLRI